MSCKIKQLIKEIKLTKNYNYSRKHLKEIESLVHGKNTLAVEVTNISSHGVWLLTFSCELFLSFDDFPWFKNQTIESIINVKEQSHGHYYWPDIDVDLTEEMIGHPERFPLKAKTT